MKYRSLEAFVLDPNSRNEYIVEFGLQSYYRKQQVFIEGKFYKVLCRANTTNPRRSSNIDINPKKKSTGRYRKLDNLTFELAKQYGYDGIYVESVLNEFLKTKLLDYGYSLIKNNYEEFNYIKLNLGKSK
jgi:hypothetical protein